MHYRECNIDLFIVQCCTMILDMARNEESSPDEEKRVMMARRLREFANDSRQAAAAAEAVADRLENARHDDITGLMNASLDPRQLNANAVSVPSVAARKAIKAADTLAAMAASGPNPLSIHETSRLRGVAVNTMRRRLPFINPAEPEPPTSGSEPF